ncbi:ankyrin repeat-containing protein [Tanacetum coccineum]|uniref:Ankyrin repeat-containing protein n=1 Tax=Tanacetum coccineum TaxID=301880 RepID=A0ABQ5CWW4_9ASTR
MANNIALTPIREEQQHVAPTLSTPFPQLQINSPCADLLHVTKHDTDSRREDYLEIWVPLYEASMTGDWRTAESIIKKHPEVVRCSITENNETALHVAASAKNTHFVKILVKHMKKEDMELQNKNSNTALSLAAAAGAVTIAKIIVVKNITLLTIPNSQKMMPLYMAALFGKTEMVKYLYGQSHKLQDDGWTSETRGWLLSKCVEADLFEVALDILKAYPELGDDGSVLHVLARKPDAFKATDSNFHWRIINSISAVLHLKMEHTEKKNNALEIVRTIWKRIVKKSKKQIDHIIRGPSTRKDNKTTHPSRMLFVAAEMGNTTFIIELIRYYPDLIWKLGSMRDLITPLKDHNENNMLHLVGEVAKQRRLQNVSGVALQMQRELLWFKEVEQMIPSTYRDRKNKEGQTLYELFTDKHKELVTKGEEWMKGTASQCMVVAALIATIVFAAAFTVPGGYNQEYGVPLFLERGAFITFIISDAISLFSSSASILMFLSILTSRYAERDFLESLPKKLMIGLATLFLSITTMMIAFSVSFFVLYHNKLRWVPFFISLFATMPVILFATLQYPLLADVFQSTYASSPCGSVCGKRVIRNGYYLADGIYPEWASFVKSFTVATDPKHTYFKQRQESARKDVERAFGVLQGRWGLIQQPARAYEVNTLRRIMYAGIIMHNRI